MGSRLETRQLLGRVRLTARNCALIAIALVIVIGAVLRTEAIGGNTRVSSDEFGNGANTNSVLKHSRYATLRWPPGTPVLFALATRLHGQRKMTVLAGSHEPAQYAQLAIEIATLMLIALVTWMLGGPWPALIAVALAATYIPLVLVTRTYLSEPLGGLAILGTFAVAAAARKRGMLAIAAAGLLAGLACLVREDLFPAVIVIAVALICNAWRSSHRQALLRGVIYMACAIVAIAPWVIYASQLDGRFVPITDGGPDALFIGTYLPGHGQLNFVEKAFKGPVCRRFPKDCQNYESLGAQPIFRLLRSRYPGLSDSQAVTKATLHNLRVYAIGKPFAFAGMLLHKLWGMWAFPWSGGNGAKHPDTSRVQHLIFVGLAWLGLLGGAVLTRRWSLVTVTVGLLLITALNILVNAQGRDNVRLMPVLLTYGAGGLWFLVLEMRTRSSGRLART
jgi:hypothetical protein